ncbi:hypothetical protein [Halapricum hydrolyticum]|uniref:Uncharacterized protein n=1 Tax=Halapricum hydrolyticum TaxID=2979991 RepID=A0AAE3IEK3_9EURY|nr:hypothetical protein [Halapricum hydrolyticum]MCU4717979.1 hypothetical protein [Halapricum hydrolyticum]MCU4727144.1 hypothetical protein [Halapricum hydrolyticum]
METRRTVLATLVGAGIAGLAGCASSSEDETTTERTTTWPSGEILAIPIDRDLNPEEPVTYPNGDTENDYVTQALEAAATSGESSTVEIQNETALERVQSVIQEYPSAPDDVERSGTLVSYEGDYYVLQLVDND